MTRSARRGFVVLMGGAALLAVPPRVQAGSYDQQPKLTLHVTAVPGGNQCSAGQISDCSQAVTRGGLYPPNLHHVYLLAHKGPVDRLGGVECGIHYRGSAAGPGLSIYSWQTCGSLDFPSTAWPSPGGGNAMTWGTQSCPSTETAVCGYFYVGAYAPDTLRLTVRPVSGATKIASCESAETPLTTLDLGYAAFSAGATIAGCNSCADPCPGSPPTRLHASSNCISTSLTWNPVDVALGYLVYRDGVSLTGQTLISPPAFVDESPGSSAHCYQVSAVSATGESARSLAACTAAAGSAAPQVIEQPKAVSIVSGRPVAIQVRASNAENADFQWRHNGIPLQDGPNMAGSDGSRLLILSATAGDAGSYDVQIISPCGTVSSQPASLLIQPPGTPDWRQGMYDANANYFQTRQIADAYYASHDSLQTQPGFKNYRRWRWFWSNRVDSTGSFKAANLAMHDYLVSNTNARKLQVQSAGDAWQPAGPMTRPVSTCQNGVSGTGMGMVAGLYVEAAHPNHLFVGSSSGGIFSTVDGGANWVDLNNGIPSQGVNDILYDPATTTLTIATGTTRYSRTYGQGVLRSNDDGASWSTTLLSFDPSKNLYQEIVILKLIIPNPNFPQTMLAISKDTVYKTSTGFVANYSTTLTDPEGGFKDIEVVPGMPSTILVSGNKIYRSTNSGAGWTNITSTLTAAGNPTGFGLPLTSRTALATSPAAPGTIWALVNVTGPLSIVKSGDGGVTWTTVAEPSVWGADEWCMEFAISPTDTDRMYIGGVRLHRSLNGGQSWTPITDRNVTLPNFAHDDIRNLRIFNSGGSDVVLAATDGGVSKSTNNGTTWTDLSNGLNIAQYYDVAGSELDPSLVLCGAQDKGIDMRTSTGWKNVGYGDGAVSAIDPTNAMNMFTTFIPGQCDVIARSANGGCDWLTTLPPPCVLRIYPPLVMDPADPKHLLVGFGQLWETKDGAASAWSMKSLPVLGDVLRAIAFAPSNSNVYYVSRGEPIYKDDPAELHDYIFRTVDGGDTYVDITGRHATGKLFALRTSGLTGIAVNPTNPGQLWVSLGGVGPGSGFIPGEKVYTSSDFGENWYNFSAGLPNLPVNCIAYERGSDNLLYVGTDVGVYYRSSFMKAWQPFKSGMPDMIVADLDINYSSGRLRAATHARGLWESTLANCPILTTGPDASVRDSPADVGSEPNVESGSVLWDSQEIWVRNFRDKAFNNNPPRFDNERRHQNPEHAVIPTNRPWVYAKYLNRGSAPVSGTVHLYWAAASTGLEWPGSWTNGTTGALIGSAPITNLLPGACWVVEKQWLNIPDPANFNGDQHFCLLARFVASTATPDPIVGETGGSTWNNVQKSNNIAWKNVTVTTLVSNKMANRAQLLSLRNFRTQAAVLSFPFTLASPESSANFLDHGTIRVELGQSLFSRWQAAGSLGTGIQAVGDSAILITGMPAELTGIPFAALEAFDIRIKFNLFDPSVFDEPLRYKFGVAQWSEGSSTPDGGEIFDIDVGPAEVSGLPDDPPQAGPGSLSCVPNPIRQAGTIRLRIAATAVATVRLYDIQGRMIREIMKDQLLSVGDHAVPFNPNGIASGIYFCRVSYTRGNGISQETLKIIVQR